MDDKNKLHVVMVPWLAFGHMMPFLELSKCLAQKGHRISFVSTPRNIKRLPKIPPNLLPLIDFVELHLPRVDNLPETAEATSDVPPNMVHYLNKAFDGLKDPLVDLLEDLAPDWIVYDFAACWLPPFASKLGIPCAFYSLFNAAAVSFFGPPSVLMGNHDDSFTPCEDLTIVSKWITFPTNVALRFYESSRILDAMKENCTGLSGPHRYGLAVEASDIVFIRSSMEYEQFWLNFLEEKILKKPVIPTGLLPPAKPETKDDVVGEWAEIKAWLDKQRKTSVIYVALGTEATLTQEEVTELAFGLELSDLPFFWVLRKPTSDKADSYLLPTGFEDRVRGRGVVCTGLAPQVKILSHPSVGGVLTHCGWSSIIESLSFGLALVLLPLLAEQGLNARVLHGDKIGLEIPRNMIDGSFTRDSVAETVKTVMVDEKGEMFRTKAREMIQIFGNKDISDQYVDKFIQYLQDHKNRESNLLKVKLHI